MKTIIPLVFSLFFVLTCFFFHKKIKKLEDLRTLKLGRYTVFRNLSLLLAINGIFSVFFLAPVNFGYLENLIRFELLVVCLPLLVSGSIVPFMTGLLLLKRGETGIKMLVNLLFPALMFFFFLISIFYLVFNFAGFQLRGLSILAMTYPVLAISIGWQFFIFYSSSRIYGRKVKSLETDYFLVLGAGLINGNEVGPLLARRIKAAVSEANEKTIFIFSGGKGSDESLTEASAMQKYAMEELALPVERIILEEEATTTYENLLNASSLTDDKFMIFTSDFHAFRAALFASELGLEAQAGKGGATSLSYRIPAFFREFIALMDMERKKHILMVATIVISFTFLSIFHFFY